MNKQSSFIRSFNDTFSCTRYKWHNNPNKLTFIIISNYKCKVGRYMKTRHSVKVNHNGVTCGEYLMEAVPVCTSSLALSA